MSAFERLTQVKNEQASTNLAKVTTFLASNRDREGVVETASGLQYDVLTLGTGEKPLANHTVTCHYHGTTLDGSVFDSSVQRGVPASFPLNMVIKGWTEGLQYMPTGSKFRFFIPANLAYGERQVSALIGANSTLIFDVELISFK
jgi:FKBP-type peptidyl-prolyl cis-trans isomerase FklB